MIIKNKLRGKDCIICVHKVSKTTELGPAYSLLMDKVKRIPSLFSIPSHSFHFSSIEINKFATCLPMVGSDVGSETSHVAFAVSRSPTQPTFSLLFFLFFTHSHVFQFPPSPPATTIAIRWLIASLLLLLLLLLSTTRSCQGKVTSRIVFRFCVFFSFSLKKLVWR